MQTVAFLNNHNTAVPFVVSMLHRQGAETYIPLKCPEVGSLSGQAARDIRTAALAPDVEILLDEVDVYSPELTVTGDHVAIMDATFDLVIIPGAVRTPNLIHLAESLRTIVVIYEWGDTGGTIIHPEYSRAVGTRPNVHLAVAYDVFGSDHIHLPLLLPESLSPGTDLEGNHYPSPTFAVVASRINHEAGYTRDNVIRFLEGIERPHDGLAFLGKDHNDPTFFSDYRKHWGHVYVDSDLPRDELLNRFRSVNALLYWIRESAILQFTALECTALGTPVVYFHDTLLSRYMPPGDPCRISVPGQIDGILTLLADRSLAHDLARAQSNSLASLSENADEKWARILKLDQATARDRAQEPARADPTDGEHRAEGTDMAERHAGRPLDYWRDLTPEAALSEMLDDKNRCVTLEVFDQLTTDPVFTAMIRTSIEAGRLDLRLAIAWLARMIEPDRYLEIGVRRGFSMSTLAAIRPHARIFGFDMWVEDYVGVSNPGVEFVRGELNRVGYRGNAQFVSGNSHETLPVFFGRGKPRLWERILGQPVTSRGDLDMILVDGDHSILGAYRDLCDVMPHVRVGGAVIFDDIAPDLSGFDEAGIQAVRDELGDDPHGWGGLLGVWHAIQSDFPNYRYFEFTQDSPGVAFAIRMK